MKLKNILIITGGSTDTAWAESWLENQKKKGAAYDYCIAADSGLSGADRLGIKVDYMLGDYDSVDKNILEKYKDNVPGDVYPAEKDYTDTELAVKLAVGLIKDSRRISSSGICEDSGTHARITIIGATGTRLDHTLANIGLLEQIEAEGIEGYIIDRHNRIRMLLSPGKDTVKIRRSEQYGSYVSCIALTPVVRGLTMKGFRYPLCEHELTQGISLCVSNEITEEECVIAFREGKLLVLETND